MHFYYESKTNQLKQQLGISYRPLEPLAVGPQSQALSNDALAAMAVHVFAVHGGGAVLSHMPSVRVAVELV